MGARRPKLRALLKLLHHHRERPRLRERPAHLAGEPARSRGGRRANIARPGFALAVDATEARLGLCLSGGGFRAAFYALGALGYLAEAGHLRRVPAAGVGPRRRCPACCRTGARSPFPPDQRRQTGLESRVAHKQQSGCGTYRGSEEWSSCRTVRNRFFRFWRTVGPMMRLGYGSASRQEQPEHTSMLSSESSLWLDAGRYPARTTG